MSRTVNNKHLSDVFDIDDQFEVDEDVEKSEISDNTEDIYEEDTYGDYAESESVQLSLQQIEDSKPVAPLMRTIATIESPSVKSEEENYINDELKELVEDVKDVIGNAKYLINSSPNESNVEAASHLFNSAASVLKELNKNILQEKRAKHNFELEKMKIRARQDLAEYKAQQKDLGSGNVFIDNRQQSVSFSQESIIKDILKLQKTDDEDIIES